MGSKRFAVMGLGLGALLVAVGACGQGSRHDGRARANGSSAAVTGDVIPCQVLFPSHCPTCSNYCGGNGTGAPMECFASGDAEPLNDVRGGPSWILSNNFLYPFDPRQDGWFGPPFAPTTPPGTPTCDTPNPVPSVIDRGLTQSGEIESAPFRFRNWTDEDACISVYATKGTTPVLPDVNSGTLQIAAYVGPFDPNDIQQNVVAASAPVSDAGGAMHIAFKVPANTNFEVILIGKPVVHERLSAEYNVFVAGCGQVSTDTDAGASSSSSGGASSSSSGGNGNDAGSSDNGGKTW